jgi:hypothetical protein
MDGAIFSSLIAAAATIISGYMLYSAHRSTESIRESKETIAELQRELLLCYHQIAAYHQLEDILIEPLLAGKDMKAVKGAYRSMVVEKGFKRPEVTRTQATKRINELLRFK